MSYLFSLEIQYVDIWMQSSMFGILFGFIEIS